jgi:hypothetical protein
MLLKSELSFAANPLPTRLDASGALVDEVFRNKEIRVGSWKRATTPYEVGTGSGSDRVLNPRDRVRPYNDPVATAPGTDLISLE